MQDQECGLIRNLLCDTCVNIEAERNAPMFCRVMAPEDGVNPVLAETNNPVLSIESIFIVSNDLAYLLVTKILS